MARREEGRALLQAAIEAGDLRRDIDVDTCLDCLYGPIFFRVFVGHAEVDADFCDRLLNELLQGVGRGRGRRRPGRSTD